MSAADYAAGLRQLADFIEANPEMPEPVYLKTLHLWSVRTVEGLRAIGFAAARAGFTVTKRYSDHYDHMSLDTTGLGPLKVQALADRSLVCERVLVGTETVVDRAPDPDAPLVTIPDPTVTKSVERTVERYEWRCAPTGAGEPEQVSA